VSHKLSPHERFSSYHVRDPTCMICWDARGSALRLALRKENAINIFNSCWREVFRLLEIPISGLFNVKLNVETL
jgi:hypothetical protein